MKLFKFLKKNICTITILSIILGLLVILGKRILHYSENFNTNDIYVIKKSSINGVGVFSNKNIEKDEKIDLALENKLNINTNSLYVDITNTFGSLINHCEVNDNSYLKREGNKYYLHAKKYIPKGVEITNNYKKAPDTINKNTNGFKKC